MLFFNMASDNPLLMSPPKGKILNLLTPQQTANSYNDLFRPVLSGPTHPNSIKVFDIVNVRDFTSMQLRVLQGRMVGVHYIPGGTRQSCPLRSFYTTLGGGRAYDLTGIDYICFVPVEDYLSSMTVDNNYCTAYFV